MKPTAQRALTALQAEEWIDMDRLIALAEIETPDDDLDTRINALAAVLDELEAAGYPTEMVREAGGDFYRLI